MSKLGSTIKMLESDCEIMIDLDKPFIVRIDGHKFSKYTKEFEKPCCERMEYAMIHMTLDVVSRFNARLGFCASDEATFVFPGWDDPKHSHPFNGRVQKISSLVASYASIRFNYHMKHFKDKIVFNNVLSKLIYRFTQLFVRESDVDDAYFDARTFQVKDDEQAYEAVWWRYQYDTFNNGVSAIAQTLYTHKQLENKTTKERIHMIEEKGHCLDNYSPHLLYGTFVKKQVQYSEDKSTYRSSMRTMSIPKWNDVDRNERIRFVMDKLF